MSPLGIAVDVPDTAGRRKRFGNMILSRYPVGQVLRHALAWEADDCKSMPRLMVEAAITTPFGPLRMMTSHLEYYSGKLRDAAVRSIRAAHLQACARAALPPRAADKVFRPHPGQASAILTGDFNMRPDDPVRRELLRDFDGRAPALVDAWSVHHPTQPHPVSLWLYEPHSGVPHCCDFVLLTADLAPRVRQLSYDHDSRASDHQPVVLEINDRLPGFSR